MIIVNRAVQGSPHLVDSFGCGEVVDGAAEVARP